MGNLIIYKGRDFTEKHATAEFIIFNNEIVQTVADSITDLLDNNEAFEGLKRVMHVDRGVYTVAMPSTILVTLIDDLNVTKLTPLYDAFMELLTEKLSYDDIWIAVSFEPYNEEYKSATNIFN